MARLPPLRKTPFQRPSFHEGLLGLSVSPASGLIHRSQLRESPKWPSKRNPKENNPREQHVETEESSLKEEFFDEIDKIKKEIAEIKSQKIVVQSPQFCALTPPLTPTGIPPPPPPPPSVEFLKRKPQQLQFNRKSRKSEQILNATVKKVDMTEVIKNIGKVTLKKTDRSPGGTPTRRSTPNSDRDCGHSFRDRLRKV